MMIPLLRKGTDSRIVNVASQLGRLSQIESRTLQKRFSSETLTLIELNQLVDQFESSVKKKCNMKDGWGNSNYGISKLAVIAATKVMARLEDERAERKPKDNQNDTNFIKVNCCCPGYCDTDMTSHMGPRPPSDGARNAVILATMPRKKCPSGAFYKNYEPAIW